MKRENNPLYEAYVEALKEDVMNAIAVSHYGGSEQIIFDRYLILQLCTDWLYHERHMRTAYEEEIKFLKREEY